MLLSSRFLLRRFSYKLESKSTGDKQFKDFNGLLEKYFEQDLPTTRKCLLVRHGQSVGNIKNLLYGHLDYELTDMGYKEAEHLQPQLAPIIDKFQGIITSDLARCVQTAKTCFDIQEDQVDKLQISDVRLREFNFGGLEGLYCGNMTNFEHEFLFQL